MAATVASAGAAVVADVTRSGRSARTVRPPIPDGAPPLVAEAPVEVVEVEVVELDSGEEIVVVEGSGEES